MDGDKKCDSGEKADYATEKPCDVDLGREKKMGDAEEPLKAAEMGHGKLGPTST